MTISTLIEQVKAKQLIFKDVLAFIEENYSYTASAFKNGTQENAVDQNQGSAKVLFFAKINEISKEDTLELFAEHYESVLNTPEGNDHQNIRQFQINGWNGVTFENNVLLAK